MVASGAEPRERLLQFKATAVQSAADVRAYAAALDKQQHRTAYVRAEARQAEAQVGAVQAQVDSARIDYGATVIRAAIAGRVGDRTVSTGQYVQAGTRLMTVVPLDRLYVVANFKETQLARMRPGQLAKVVIDAIDGDALPGRVESVSPGTGARFSLVPPNNATGNFTKIVQRVPVRIAIAATAVAGRSLVPGLSASVTVDTRSDPRPVREDGEPVSNRFIKATQDVPPLPARRAPPSERSAVRGTLIAVNLSPASAPAIADATGGSRPPIAHRGGDVGRR